ncbi:zf-HC2 domain-containing protein [Tomitella biformata]|uniref:zf-HC2 domain-containing protein n=1 Tax=Tomitella biformata TaxID=630403 RepID=UPI0004660769|nr:zf-HC2 domain-containing protein [Tomitella biformata]
MTEQIGPFRGRGTDSSFSLGSARMTSVGHLTTEAVAAYADGELRMGPHLRASAHLGSCPQCAAEVEAQRRIRADLQGCAKPAMSDSLLSTLRSIPLSPSGASDTTDRPAEQAGGHGGLEGRGKLRWRWPF